MMSSEEQKQILKMVEEGKISAEEALRLIQALETPVLEDEVVPAPASTFASESGAEEPHMQEFEEIASKARGLWQIPLWIGVLAVVLSSYWLYNLVIASNYGFWFYCALLPLLSGVLLLALFTSSRTSRWLYVNVEQPDNEWPHNITLGLPLPLGLAGWFLRNFGQSIEGLNQAAVDEILEFLSTGFSSKEPLIVTANEGHGGARVQVFIG
jgi:SHOCT-like domain